MTGHQKFAQRIDSLSGQCAEEFLGNCARLGPNAGPAQWEVLLQVSLTNCGKAIERILTAEDPTVKPKTLARMRRRFEDGFFARLGELNEEIQLMAMEPEGTA